MTAIDPDYYCKGKTQVIDHMLALTNGRRSEQAVLLATAIKYIGRAGLKDPDTYVQDLDKAIWYLNKAKEYPMVKTHYSPNELVNKIKCKYALEITMNNGEKWQHPCQTLEMAKNLLNTVSRKLENGWTWQIDDHVITKTDLAGIEVAITMAVDE